MLNIWIIRYVSSLLFFFYTGGFTDADANLMADKIAFQSRIPAHVNVVKFLKQVDDSNETGMNFNGENSLTSTMMEKGTLFKWFPLKHN